MTVIGDTKARPFLPHGSSRTQAFLLAVESGYSGVKAAETEESVTLGRIRKRKRWDSQRSFTPDSLTLGAMRTGVKQFNTGLDSSTILARCKPDAVSESLKRPADGV